MTDFSRLGPGIPKRPNRSIRNQIRWPAIRAPNLAVYREPRLRGPAPGMGPAFIVRSKKKSGLSALPWDIGLDAQTLTEVFAGIRLGVKARESNAAIPRSGHDFGALDQWARNSSTTERSRADEYLTPGDQSSIDRVPVSKYVCGACAGRGSHKDDLVFGSGHEVLPS